MADALFREQLISVQGWLAAHESGDDAAVLDDRAVDAARQLAGSTAVDAVLADEARRALAQFWWHRFWALPPGRNDSELRLAVAQASGVYPAGRQIPAGLSALLAADPGLTGDPRDWAKRAARVLSDDDAGLPELMESIELLRVASQATEVDKEERAAFLANEATMRSQKYGHTRQLIDLDDAVEAARTGLAALGDHSDAFFLLNGNLALLLRARFGATGAAADIDDAITAGRAAAARESSHQAILLSGLGIALRLRFTCSGGAADLDEAIEAGRAAATAMSAAEPERTVTLDNLARALLERFGRSRSRADLDEAIEAARAAVGIPGGRNLESAFSTFASSLGVRLELDNELADLEDAIAAARAVIRSGDHRQSGSADRSRLAALLRMRFMRLGEIADLATAVALRREVLAAAGDDPDDRARRQFALAVELGTQAGVTRGDRDLCEAILLFTSALGPDPAIPAAERPRLRVAAARLTEWAATGDASVLFDPELTAVLADLATVNPRNPPDLSALCLAGWLHLLRYNFAGQEEEQAELLAAAGALHPVYLVAPFAVPDPVALLYDDDEQEVEDPGAAPLSPGNDEYHRVNAAAMQLMSRYAASGDLGTLREAVSGFRRAVAVTASDAESVAVVHNNLALALLTLAQQTGDHDDISGAVAAGRVAVENSAPRHPYLPGRMSLLCGVLTLLGGDSRDLAVLDEAIDVGRNGLALTPAGHPSLEKYLSNLAIAYYRRYQIGRSDHSAAGIDGDLREAVSLLRQALAAGSASGRDNSAHSLNLAVVLEAVSERTRDLTTLTESVQLVRDALTSAPPDPVRLLLLDRLGSALTAVYEETGEPERLAEAMGASRAALTGTPVDDPAHAGRMEALISQTNLRYIDTGDSRARRQVIELLREHTGKLPDTVPVKAAFLALLGLLLPDLTTADDQAVLAEAAAALRAAVALTPRDSREFGQYSKNLADALARLYERTSVPVLAEAAAAARDAVRDAVRPPAETEAELRDRLRILINILRTRYETTGDLAELDEAIGAAERALTCGGDVEWQLERAALLFTRAAGTGQVREMREAAGLVRDVLAQPGADRKHAANAGTILTQLYGYTGALEDLDEGIGLLRLSVDSDGSEQWVAKNTLAQALESRYRRTGDVTALSEAVEVSRAAAADIPPTYAYRSLYLSNLGQLLGELSAVTGDVPLLAEGVDAARASVLAARAAPAYRPDHLAALSQLLLRLDGRTRDEQALNEAVRAGREAVSDSQEPTANHAKHLAIFGAALLRQHSRDGDLASLAEACRVLPSAATQAAASLGDRVTAARMWGEAAMLASDPAQALRGYEYALDLLLQQVGPELAQGDREYGIEESAGLPGEAAAAAIAAGDPARAVELLEHGRGILLGEALHFRSDMSQLEVLDPGLAMEFRRIGGQLAALRRQPSGQPMSGPHLNAGPAAAPAPPSSRAAERRAALAAEFAQIAMRIRAVPGFADFMRVPTLDMLRDGIGPGPVAVVNASRWRCDALIVTPGGVDVVPLRGLTLEAITGRANEYLESIQAQQRALQEVLWLRQHAAGPDIDPAAYRRYHAAKVELAQTSGQMERTLLATMAWLWDGIAEPVLTRLGHTSRPATGASWPRIWWCPTGPLTLLPLHAAGNQEATTGGLAGDRAVIERAVSSYAPSLRAMIEARRPVPGPPGDDLGMLVVAMPQTAGQEPLPNAERERDLLGRLFQGHSTMLTGPAATVQAVLSALPAHRWAHFSCHGDQDLAAPSRGGLLLADGILSVADIGGERYQGEFAFLSACKTGTGGVTLMDEAITLAAALQYAGYRHVVATSWSVYDAAAADVAERVYKRLAVNGLLQPKDTALALHAAIRPLRDLFPGRPSVWMPFTHLGS